MHVVQDAPALLLSARSRTHSERGRTRRGEEEELLRTSLGVRTQKETPPTMFGEMLPSTIYIYIFLHIVISGDAEKSLL